MQINDSKALQLAFTTGLAQCNWMLEKWSKEGTFEDFLKDSPAEHSRVLKLFMGTHLNRTDVKNAFENGTSPTEKFINS